MDVAFNERFDFERPDQLQQEYKKGLKKGLPFPILTVAEYMSVDAEGFCWGRNYRQAGYYAGKRNYWQILQNCHKNVMKMSQNCL